jgi:hypothetical protein
VIVENEEEGELVTRNVSSIDENPGCLKAQPKIRGEGL